MAKLDIRIKESGKDSLIVEMGGRRRLLYLVIFILLCITVFLSIDPAYDFSSSRIGGTIFTFLLILVSLSVTIVVRSVKIDKLNNSVEKRIGVPFNLYVKVTKSYVLGSSPLFIMKSLSPVQPTSRLKGTSGTSRIETMSKMRSKSSLRIETEEDSVLICDGISKEEINTVATYLSQYLGIQVKSEN